MDKPTLTLDVLKKQIAILKKEMDGEDLYIVVPDSLYVWLKKKKVRMGKAKVIRNEYMNES